MHNDTNFAVYRALGAHGLFRGLPGNNSISTTTTSAVHQPASRSAAFAGFVNLTQGPAGHASRLGGSSDLLVHPLNGCPVHPPPQQSIPLSADFPLNAMTSLHSFRIPSMFEEDPGSRRCPCPSLSGSIRSLDSQEHDQQPHQQGVPSAVAEILPTSAFMAGQSATVPALHSLVAPSMPLHTWMPVMMTTSHRRQLSSSLLLPNGPRAPLPLATHALDTFTSSSTSSPISSLSLLPASSAVILPANYLVDVHGPSSLNVGSNSKPPSGDVNFIKAHRNSDCLQAEIANHLENFGFGCFDGGFDDVVGNQPSQLFDQAPPLLSPSPPIFESKEYQRARTDCALVRMKENRDAEEIDDQEVDEPCFEVR